VRAEVENFEIAALVFAPEGVNTYPTEGCPRRKRHDFVEPLFAIGVSFKLGKGAHDTLHVNRANQRATQSVAQSEISSPNLPSLLKLLKLPNLLSRLILTPDQAKKGVLRRTAVLGSWLPSSDRCRFRFPL
jgi:hypothetical protein